MTKVRIVVDTNIFISAFLKSKSAKYLVNKIFNDEYELVLSHTQLQEIEEVFKRPKFKNFISSTEIEELVNLLSLKVTMPVIYESINDCRDPKDNMILEAAVYGNAQYIITGDKDLLILNPYRGICIFNLKDFLNSINRLY